MLVVVSPAKNLDYSSTLPDFVNDLGTTEPVLMPQVKELVDTCKKLSPADLSSMMKISDKLAILNAERFSSFSFPFTTDNSRPAIYAFNGDVYAGLDAQTLNAEQTQYAQSHLRILSGLYGLLKPLDLMQPYRLEMGTKLAVGKHQSLYQYWDDTITQELNKALAKQGDDVLVNLASNEYFSSIKRKALQAKVITPVFKDEKNGKYKVISFFAKKARGLMARYIVEHQVNNIADLKKFDMAGYSIDNDASSETELIFTRPEQA